MSAILWKNFVYPKGDQIEEKNFSLDFFSPASMIRNVRCFKADNKTLLGDKKQAARSSSRSCALMKYACSSLPEELVKKMKVKKFRTGIYCGVENGTVDYETVKTIFKSPSSDFVKNYKSLRNPKMYLKQLPNLAAAQLGIFYDLRGPLYVFTHSENGAVHAVEQALFDLNQDNIDYALVVSAFSSEDELNLLKNSEKTCKKLSEGAIAVVLKKGMLRSYPEEKTSIRYQYGLLTKLIKTIGFRED